MIRNNKIMAASLTLMLGTFALAGCTTIEPEGVTDNSVVAAQEQAPAESTGEDTTSSATIETAEGEDTVSSATGGKENHGEKGP